MERQVRPRTSELRRALEHIHRMAKRSTRPHSRVLCVMARLTALLSCSIVMRRFR